ILSREITKLGYGAESPYARVPEYATIAAITRDDLLAFHKRFVHPNNIILSFIGDFDAARVEKKLRDTFASWPRGPQAPKPSLTNAPAKPGVYFVPKEDVTQANIAFVHPGITRNNPDYYAVVVMNDIFSGGFSGRLMQRLRSERGLTYGVGGGLGADWDHEGLFRVSMATKSGTTHESIGALKQEVTKLTTEPVTEAELSLAKDSILNAFVFTMDTRAKALNQQVLLEFYGFPRDYFEKYPERIRAVTAEDVQRVARKYVRPDQLAVLVVGNEKDFERPLNTLGTVTPIDITIPEPGGAQQQREAPAAGSNAEGTALVNKVAEFVGGRAAVGAVNAMQRTAQTTLVTPQGAMQMDITVLTQLPQSTRVVMNTPMGTMSRVITPTGAFMIGPDGSAQDLPASQREGTLSDLKGDMIAVLKNIDNPKYTFNATGTEKVGDVQARIVEINADGSSVKWHVDPGTGRLLRTVTRASAPVPGEVVTEYTEWKKFGNLNLPAAQVVTRNGEKIAEMKVTNIEVNPTIAADAFTKPPAKQ
ncbi:MAG TPA: pitrilysin family protein, partial [Vicinamibacterales bacterium]|nr:pitrilysin family protein [Vicinamibacterales bacterium]